MFPALGVGIVLVPWGAISLLGGDAVRGITLLIAFVVIQLLRNILEPKLIGAQLGLPAIATLIAMYVGFCTAGVLGMAMYPMALLVVKRLNDKGMVRIWK
jgi:predicted PurR-regulated permease PerM